MYVKTFKFSKKAAVLIVGAIAILLVLIVIAVGMSGGSEGGVKPSPGSNVKTNDDRLAYLAGLGWECESDPVDEQQIVIPRQFSEIFKEYNDLQKAQGFDLSEYCGLEATMYRYMVTNYPSADEPIIAQLIVLNYQVIGGDIHSTAIDGFMHGLK